MEPTETRIKPAPVFDLDPAAIGTMLQLMPAVATRVGHKTVKGHLWYGAATSPEEQFVRDMFKLSMPEMVEKWYGGKANAGQYAAEVAEVAAARIPRRRKANALYIEHGPRVDRDAGRIRMG